MSLISEIVSLINDSFVDAAPCLEDVKLYGLTEIVTKDGKSWPVVNTSGKGTDVFPDTRQDKIYWRWNSGPVINDDGDGFGEFDKQFTLGLTLFYVGTVKSDKCTNSQENALMIVLDAINRLKLTSATAINIQSTSEGVNPDKAAIMNAEFKGYEFESRILELIAFSASFEFTGQICEVLC